MLAKRLIALAFTTHALLGNFCMMPMAMAKDMPMNDDDSAMEEMMTPAMAPMSSHADCAHCLHHTEKKEPVQQSSACAGHCLSQATSDIPANIVFGWPQLFASLPASIPVAWNIAESTMTVPLVNESPPPILTHTVVLRL